jgi:hypothetical protein
MKIVHTAKVGDKTYKGESEFPNAEGDHAAHVMNHQLVQAVSAIVNQVNGAQAKEVIDELSIKVTV